MRDTFHVDYDRSQKLLGLIFASEIAVTLAVVGTGLPRGESKLQATEATSILQTTFILTAYPCIPKPLGINLKAR